MTAQDVIPTPTVSATGLRAQIVVKFHEGVSDGDRAKTLAEISATFPGSVAQMTYAGIERDAMINLFERLLSASPPPIPYDGPLELTPPTLADYFLSYAFVACPAQFKMADALKFILDNFADAVDTSYTYINPFVPTLPGNGVSAKDFHQSYLDPAPTGIGARLVFGKGDGAGVGLVDIEEGWPLDNPDLPVTASNLLETPKHMTGQSHGAAVLGIICAKASQPASFAADEPDAVGIAPLVGEVELAPDTDIITGYHYHQAVPALFNALVHMAYSNLNSNPKQSHVLLLEAQANCTLADGDSLKLPAEADVLVSFYVRAAVALGVTVVEAAGNGALNLDDQKYAATSWGTLLDKHDSGAIIVGGSQLISDGVTPAKDYHRWWGLSNYGSRVDCFAQAEDVATYTDDQGQHGYTNRFNGTSAATAIVTGAALVAQSYWLSSNKGRQPLLPAQLRKWLKQKPTLNTDLQHPIGVMPDLANVLADAPQYPDEPLPISLWNLLPIVPPNPADYDTEPFYEDDPDGCSGGTCWGTAGGGDSKLKSTISSAGKSPTSGHLDISPAAPELHILSAQLNANPSPGLIPAIPPPAYQVWQYTNTDLPAWFYDAVWCGVDEESEARHYGVSAPSTPGCTPAHGHCSTLTPRSSATQQGLATQQGAAAGVAFMLNTLRPDPNDPPGTVNVYIGPDQLQAGDAAAREAIKTAQFPRSRQIYIVGHDTTNPIIDQRAQGIVNAVSQHNFFIPAAKIVVNELQPDSDLSSLNLNAVFIACTDEVGVMLMSRLQVLLPLPPSPPAPSPPAPQTQPPPPLPTVIGIGGDIAKVKSGQLTATVGFFPKQQGRVIVDQIIFLRSQGKAISGPLSHQIQAAVVTQANLANYDLLSLAHPLPPLPEMGEGSLSRR